MSLSPGTRLGSYDVIALIGQGGIGGGVSLAPGDREPELDECATKKISWARRPSGV